MFSSIKMEEYMEAERSRIFLAKLVAKNILFGSSGIRFLHMRVNEIVKYNHLQDQILIVKRFTAFN